MNFKVLTILLYWVFISNSQIACPIFFCDDSVMAACLYHEDSIYIYNDCVYPNTYCPDFSYSARNNVYCLEGTEEPDAIPSCYKYSNPGQSCSVFACAPGFYCDGVCVKSPDVGSSCKSSCGVGLVCDFGVCLKYFSLPSGSYAQTKLACSSGLLSNYICQPDDKSLVLPQACTSDEDCVGTSGLKSVCKCVLNKEPQAYCTLHSSDELVVQAIKASSDGDVHKYKLLWTQVLNYPNLQYSDPCYEKNSIELKQYKLYQTEYLLCLSNIFIFGLGIALIL